MGEQVLCNSIRRAILSQRPESKITVGSMFGLDKTIAAEGDKNITSEEKLIELIDSGNYTTLVGDPLFEDLLAEDSSIKLVTLPHVALSSKLYWDKMPRLLTEEMDAFLEEIIGKEAFHIVA